MSEETTKTGADRVAEIHAAIAGAPFAEGVTAMIAVLFMVLTDDNLNIETKEMNAVVALDFANNVASANGVSEDRINELMLQANAVVAVVNGEGNAMVLAERDE